MAYEVSFFGSAESAEVVGEIEQDVPTIAIAIEAARQPAAIRRHTRSV